MAKLNSRKFTLEDFKDQSWIGALLSPLNNFIQEVYSGFQNNLTVTDNLYQEIKTIKFVNDSSNFPLKFETKFNRQPVAVQIIYAVATNGTTASAQPWPTWSFADGSLTISALTGLTAGLTYNIKIFVIYG